MLTNTKMLVSLLGGGSQKVGDSGTFERGQETKTRVAAAQSSKDVSRRWKCDLKDSDHRATTRPRPPLRTPHRKINTRDPAEKGINHTAT